MIAKQSSFRAFPEKRFRATVGLSMDMKYECECGYIWSILVKHYTKLCTIHWSPYHGSSVKL